MSQFDMKKARAKALAITQARDDLTDYLQKYFPAGARCEVLLSCVQKTPTTATIYGARGDTYGGTITVEIDTAKSTSRQRFRRVSPDCVSSVQAPKGATK